jgi:hypothetical protein
MINYNSSQLFHNMSFCKASVPDALCVANKTYDTLITKKKAELESSKEKYQNALDLYNRELLYTFNMSLGIGALVMYFIYNQNVLPIVGKK